MSDTFLVGIEISKYSFNTYICVVYYSFDIAIIDLIIITYFLILGVWNVFPNIYIFLYCSDFNSIILIIN